MASLLPRKIMICVYAFEVLLLYVTYNLMCFVSDLNVWKGYTKLSIVGTLLYVRSKCQ